MTRLGAVFWGGLVLASGFATFNVKYAVQGIDDELGRVRRQMLAETQEIRVLSAEWAYLNQPERLAELNRSFLQLAPMTAKQLQGRVEELALRASPAGGADTMIAANPAAGSSPAATPAAVTQVAAASAVPPLPAAPAHAARAGGTPAAEVQTVEAPAGGARVADAQGVKTSGVKAQLADMAGGGGTLTEALRLLGIAIGAQTPLVPSAKAAPVVAARPAEAQGADTQIADAAARAARAADTPSEAGTGLAEALRLLGNDSGGQTPRVQLAKAAPASPASLDALISKIADTR